MPILLDEAKVEMIDRKAVTGNLFEIAAYLQENLGQKFTAYISGLKDPKEVGSWAKGTIKPRPLADMRLRYAYRVVRMILEAYGSDTAKAWLFGTNTRLKDEAPAYLLRHAETIDSLRDLVPVARAFAGSVD